MEKKTGLNQFGLRQFEQAELDKLVTESQQLPRRRTNLNLHESLDAPVQKLFIAMQTDSYVRPHRHPQQEKTELFLAIRGRFAILIFNEQGCLLGRTEIGPGTSATGAEISPNTWHTVIALEDDAIFFEVKQGPYEPLPDKDFASWAPAENDTQAADFLQWLVNARVGDCSAFA